MTNFDIDTVAACDAGAEIELLHPITNEPTGMLFSVVGKDSFLFQSLVAKASDAERRRQFAAQKRGKTAAEPKPYAETVRDGVEMLAAATTGWRTVSRNSKGEIASEKATVTLNGTELSFSEENAAKFYAARPAYKTQIDEAIANLENFIKV